MPTLSPHSKVPKYLQLAELFRSQILSGALVPGARVSTVAEIQTLHGVSQSTVDKAYALLEQEGLIVREQGRGTFVMEPGRSQSARSLGLWMNIPSTTNIYMMEVVAGVREEASRRDLQLVWLDDTKPVGSASVDAILLCCEPNEALAIGVPSRIPHVLLFHHSPDFTCIVADDFNGGKLATQHLIELGHRRIACMPSSDFDSISRRRLAGYREAMEEAGLEIEAGYMKFLNMSREADYRQNGEMVMREWLNTGWRDTGCTAIVAHNDESAIGTIKALKTAGLQVPADVSVIGFDGLAIGESGAPPLTTVKIPLREIGNRAVEALDTWMPGRSAYDVPKVVLPVQLVRGESTARAISKSGRPASGSNSGNFKGEVRCGIRQSVRIS